MLVSPTEHHPAFAGIGKVSSIPEKFGADFLVNARGVGVIGVQRKEVRDFVASLIDGRLSKEISQMCHHAIDRAILVIEGELRWSGDGILLMRGWGARSLHRDSWYALMFSLMMEGVMVLQTETAGETAQLLRSLEKWGRKKDHLSLKRRPGASSENEWGIASNREWGIHFLQGLESVGYKTAEMMWERWGVPMQWTIAEKDLEDLPGIGKVKAKKIWRALSRD